MARGNGDSTRRADMRFLTETGAEWVSVPDSKNRSEVAKYLNAVRRYLEIGDASRLTPFEGRSVTTGDGRRLPFVTDLATIDRLAEGGEVWFELYRS